MAEPRVEYKSVNDVDILRTDDATGGFEALVSVTGIFDDVGDRIRPGAYAKALKARLPRVCFAHDWKSPSGAVTAAEEWFPGDPRLPAKYHALGAGSLYVKGRFNLGTTWGKNAYEEVKFLQEIGQPAEWSIGYDAESTGKTLRNKDGTREIEEMGALFEVSPVLWGAAGVGRTETLSIKSLVANPEARRSIMAELKLLVDGEKSAAASADRNQAQRDADATSGVAKSDGSYPIRDATDLANAVADYHRAGGSTSDWNHIVARARAIGAAVPTKAADDGSATCSTCKGTGKIRGGSTRCPDCHGSGEVEGKASTTGAVNRPQRNLPSAGGSASGTVTSDGNDDEDPDNLPGGEGRDDGPAEAGGEGKAWSDAARAGALLARRSHAAPKKPTGTTKPATGSAPSKVPHLHAAVSHTDPKTEASVIQKVFGEFNPIAANETDGHSADKPAVLHAPTGSGKTDNDMASALIAQGVRMSPTGGFELGGHFYQVGTDSSFGKPGTPSGKSILAVAQHLAAERDTPVAHGTAHQHFTPTTSTQSPAEPSSTTPAPPTPTWDVLNAPKTGRSVVSRTFAPVESKAACAIQGSFEEVQQNISDALDRWMADAFPGMYTWCWLEATFPDYVVAGVGYSSGDGDWDDAHGTEYWKVPYTIEPDGCCTLGEPSLVEVQGVIVDMPTDGDEVTMLPAAKVIARAIGFKNATRMRRRLVLLANTGILPADMTPEAQAVLAALGGNVGGGMIPAAGDPNYLADVMDDSVTPQPMPTVPVDASYLDGISDNLGSGPTIQMLDGTWYYVDGHNTNMPSPDVAGNGPTYLDGIGNLPTPVLVPAGTWYGDHAGVVPGQGPDGTPAVGIGTDMNRYSWSVDPSGDGGFLQAPTPSTLSHPEGEVKNATRIRKRAKLLSSFYNAKPGAGGLGSAPHTSSLATGVTSGESMEQMSAQDQATIKAAQLFTAIKEGRVLSSANHGSIMTAHAALGAVLAQMGEMATPAGPGSGQNGVNTTSGNDEDGVPIEVEDAKGGKQVVQVKGLDPVLAMEWQMAQERKSMEALATQP